MEWVETTARTIEEAKDAALDQLGVDEQDAEFEVLEEPRAGLFGRTRGEARVRARVRPTQPRPKVERRDRRGRTAKTGRSGERRRRDGGRGPKSQPKQLTDDTEPSVGVGASTDANRASGAEPSPRGGQARSRQRQRQGRRQPTTEEQETIKMSETQLAEQGEVVRGFLVDLLDAFGLDGEVTATPADEDAVELAVTGADLGLLIGPKGGTLQAVQELSRSILQRQLPGDVHARIRVDVGGYRARRAEALQRFATQVAEEVKASGARKALEPMSPPDRKVVHDTVNEIDGVHTVSEGEDLRRRVVIIPD